MLSRFREALFWVHLVAGIAAGLVIAMMSITGIAIAFEKEILHWADRHVSQVDVPEQASRLSLDQAIEIVRQQRPDFKADYVTITRQSDLVYGFWHKFHELIYVDAYSGEIRDTRHAQWQEVFWTLETWHRFFGFEGDDLETGRQINGAANLVLVFLCLSGLYLWFPKIITARSLRAGLLFKRHARGRQRDFNWHRVFGFWSFVLLLMLSVTAVVISYEWGHRLVFTLAGEPAPKSRNFGMMKVPPPVVPEPPPGALRLPYEQLLANAQARFPQWTKVGLYLPAANADEKRKPVTLNISLPDHMPSRAWVPVELDPYTGEILQMVRFQDRSPGLRARVWIKFLHTGEAFGLLGKVIVTLATIASLVIFYTGWALSYRRFFHKKSAGVKADS